MSLYLTEESEIKAKELEGILKEGIETENKEIIEFLGRIIYPVYKLAIQETLGSYEEDEYIKRVYNN